MQNGSLELHAWMAGEADPHDTRASLDVARVTRAGRGDAAAQTWLLARVLPRVRRIARTFLASSADADDAAQNALLAILRSASTYRGDAAVEGWAGRIAVRTTLRFIAVERRGRAALSRTGDDSVDLEAEPVAPFDSPASEALPRDVRHYLDALPEAQRHAILLHHALDCSLEEIAEATGVSRDTVKSRLRLGIAALRKHVRRDIALGPRGSDE